MEEREINRNEYSEIQRHEYKGIPFFTAIYHNHVVLEPIHTEVLRALRESTIDREILWSDSAHTWSRDMTLEEQRMHLIKRTKQDIDWLLSTKPLRELNQEYREKKLRLEKERNFLLSLGDRKE